jgi:hypothetical protein
VFITIVTLLPLRRARVCVDIDRCDRERIVSRPAKAQPTNTCVIIPDQADGFRVERDGQDIVPDRAQNIVKARVFRGRDQVITARA